LDITLTRSGRRAVTYWRKLMSWTTPRVVEIAVGMEINCYACAEI
jgi:coenzyme PQQ precursor peptide PqqA